MIDKMLAQLYAEHEGKVSDKWSLYLEEYDRIFSEYRAKPIKMLEIGIQNGGSLDIWSKYFPNGEKFIGCDINPDCSLLEYEDPRISVVVGDVNTDSAEAEIQQHSSEFDIVIDDGSHFSSDIVKSFARYFPKIIDGGVFVAEDLHCSYWHDFEGGLFDPFSSITFFKHLADVINHEHWGVKKKRADLYKGFFTKFGFKLDEDLLKQVHSIEFINSICVVRKSPTQSNLLGDRFVAGKIEVVVPGLDKVRRKSLEAPSQTNNFWSARELPPSEELPLRLSELNTVKQELVDRDELIANILSSKSWKITAPLRAIGRAYRAFALLPGRVKRAGVLLGPYLLRALREPGWAMRTIRKVMIILHASGWRGIKEAITKAQRAKVEYQKWIRQYDALTEEARVTMRDNIDTFAHQPLISVVMPTYNPRPEWLVEAIESVRKQLYPYWELCIADDASSDKAIRPILEDYAKKDSRIKVVFREENGHISATSNSALELVTGEWVALLDHDDLLPEHALFWVADAINRNPDARMIYSDEDKIDDAGTRFGPYFKCDWNIDLFFSQNMFSHLGVYRTDLLREINGFRLELEGSQDYDLALRCLERIEPGQIHHIPRVLYHWRVHAESTALSNDNKPYAVLAGERALNEYCQRNGVNAKVERTDNDGYRLHYALPDSLPMVSLIIPTRNGLHLVRRCVESILNKTTYPNYEILLVDNGSDDEETLRYFETLKTESRIRILRDDRPFNYSALNNAAVKHARGELVGLVNNDIEVISPDWLSEMVSFAVQPDIGCVGARLWFPDEHLQHGGVILGIGGVAGHAHHKLPRGSIGYFSRARLIQSFSAVTAACLVIRKAIYNEIGGLNEIDLKVAFNDIDFCLRVREAGYRNVWTPYAELYHHESATRGFEDTPEKQARFAKEEDYMKRRWGDLLQNDPAYSPNLTLDREDFSYAWPPRVEAVALNSAGYPETALNRVDKG